MLAPGLGGKSAYCRRPLIGSPLEPLRQNAKREVAKGTYRDLTLGQSCKELFKW